MYKHCKIKPPFFEIGPKTYLYGEVMLGLAKTIDKIAEKYDIDIILTPQYTDISAIARETERIFVFAQHMDPLYPGRGIGSVLPEALKAAGATGVMLNHCEKRIPLSVLSETIKRADETGLITIVCADTVEEAAAIAHLSPNIIVTEPTNLIGTGKSSNMDYVKETIKTIKGINPDIMVLQGAGISNGEDVYNVIMAGAEATGSTSGIIRNPDPGAMAEEMIHALRLAWNKLHN